MKTFLFKVFNLTAILIFMSVSHVFAQTPEAVRQAEARVNQITTDAGRYFKQGLLNVQDNRRPQAGEDFDKAVEVFLMSSVNVNSNPKLNGCYTQLIETIYRMEFPSAQQPQIRSLAATCGWSVDNGLADNVVAKLTQKPLQTAANKTPGATSVSPAAGDTAADIAQGFNEQKFEPAIGDELARIELTPEEQNIVNTPEGQQQYRLIQVAIANKSFGFNFQMHPMVQQFVSYYQGRGRGTMSTGLYRSGMFMRMARRIFREEGVPENVAWLGQVESAWKPQALSWAAASGLWQFIPGTGARFGLRRTAHIDERNSFEKATRASAKYLKFLANRYGGNWELAMGAYNCGEGNVDRAIRRAGVANFWAAYPYLPQETRNYVPNILATILIANSPQQYGFGHVRPAPQLIYDQIRVPSSTNLSLLAQASDTTVEYLRYLNPELRTNVSPPEPYIVRVPSGKANEVVAVFRKLPAGNRNAAAIARTAAGETWQTLSNRTGIPVEQLIAANGGAKIPRGKIVIPQSGAVKSISYVRPATTPTVAPQTNGVKIVKAQAGDTITKLAQRHNASPIDVAKFNGLFPTSILPAGREVKIPGS
ncbi:MAG TPA: transglycosylase SLT domain-containing protein [Pyrinomonadaceae bacterium]|nr:transglycosylase SLT domain-containing protein [Pyrinomonadaceae bacterium]